MKTNEAITNYIIERIESGEELQWIKPWQTGTPKNIITGKDYRGINELVLGFAGGVGLYCTPKQAINKGWNFKGAKTIPVVFWKFGEKKNKETGEMEDYCFAKQYRVLKIEDCAGVPQELIDKYIVNNNHDPIEEAQRVCDEYKTMPTVVASGKAAYNKSKDEILMPPLGTFDKAENYYATLFHEMAHSTMAKHRLDRELDYASEELVAEICSSYLCSRTGIVDETIDSSAAYVQSWSKKMKDKPQMIMTCASKAQKAYEYIANIKREEVKK